jgi:hypothetical protein
MTNEEKAGIYHSLLLRHDRLDEKISDIKSEAAGRDLNKDQLLKVEKLEIQKEQVVAETQTLFPDFK